MLTSLFIENFAIIDNVQIDLNNGMTVLTGETGAGKSIIIDAIGQISGERTRLDFIKQGCHESLIEAIFAIDDRTEQIMKELHIPINDHQLVVSKTMNIDGKVVLKMNYKTVTQMVVKKIMPYLIDIHSQFETHQLFDTKTHIDLLDQYIGNQIADIKNEYLKCYSSLKKLEKTYMELTNEELSDEQYDFYLTQKEEIESLDLDTFNENDLLKQRQEMMNFEKNSQYFKSYDNIMNNSQGVFSMFKGALNELSHIENDDIQNNYDQLYDLYYSLQDFHDQIENIYHSFDFNEEDFNIIQEKYYLYNKLKRKYGQSIDSIREAYDELCHKIDYFKNRETILLNMENSIHEVKNKCEDLCSKMTNIRKLNAEILENKIMEILKSMYLENVRVKFIFEDKDFNEKGRDSIVINVSTNRGQVLRPLHKVASGGELSRIMLAIKTVCQGHDGSDTIIFDEADTGVSGKVAESIGNVMKKISQTQQVLCITHLAQVASFANYHLHVDKVNQNDDTKVYVSELNKDDSIKEIAKMISGLDITDESLKHAKKLKKNNA